MEVCKICGKQLKRVNQMHVASHKVTMEQYNMMPEYDATLAASDEMGEIEEKPLEEIVTTQAERNENIWGKQERDTSRPLQDFLNEFGLVDEKELREVVRKYVKGTKIDPRIQTKRDQEIGREEAQKYLGQEKVNTTSLPVAEVLVTEYGYNVVEVRGVRGSTPKTWFLVKQ